MPTTPRAAIRMIPPGARIVASPGCGTPETLLTALAQDVDLLEHPVLYSGLQLGSYPFLDAVAKGLMRYRTWHPYGPARHAVDQGTAEYVPARASAVPDLMDRWEISVALVRVSPPDANGWCSLGPSASYPRAAVVRASLVLAEVDPRTPRTLGDSMLHRSQIDVLVDSDTPPCQFHAATRDELSDRVAARVVELIPAGATVQLGIGVVPEAITAFLGEGPVRDVRIAGMATDAMVPLFDAGVLRWTDAHPTPAIAAAELMGTQTLMTFADNNPSVVLYDSRTSHAPRSLGRIPRFVAVNSAVEVDLAGQVNAEMAGHRHVSGVGGSADFVEAGFGSAGGLSVIAMTSTTRDGHSRIVPVLSSPVVTLPRHAPDVVATEWGVARLAGGTLGERAEALIAVAHPDHRAALAKEQNDLREQH